MPEAWSGGTGRTGHAPGVSQKSLASIEVAYLGVVGAGPACPLFRLTHAGTGPAASGVSAAACAISVPAALIAAAQRCPSGSSMRKVRKIKKCTRALEDQRG